MSWVPLSVRESGRLEEPFEDVPEHLRAALWSWIARYIADRERQEVDLTLRIGNRARLFIRLGAGESEAYKDIQSACQRYPQSFLDTIDAILEMEPHPGHVEKLRTDLEEGNSAWTVSPAGVALTRRIDPTAQLAAVLAMTPADEASRELAQAWHKVYGRATDASDGWDLAIKAVEVALVPIATPRQDQGQLGRVLGMLTGQPEKYELLLAPVQQGREALKTPEDQQRVAIETLAAMIRLMYPNPDRHANSENREPTLAEAQATVHLAVTIVQWARANVLTMKP